jgi:hypothetical protein
LKTRLGTKGEDDKREMGPYRKEGAIREAIAPGSGPYSRMTSSVGRRVSERERDVGSEFEGKAAAFSAPRNSRIEDRRTARPSAWLKEKEGERGRG